MKKSTILWYFTGILLVINVLLYTTQWGGERVLLVISDTLPILCSLISVICLYFAFAGFKDFDYTKKAWFLLLIGISLNFCAETLYGLLDVVYKVDMNNTFPSAADFFWCSAYIPLFLDWQ